MFEAVFEQTSIELFDDKLLQDLTSLPLLSFKDMVQLVMLVVPVSPFIFA